MTDKATEKAAEVMQAGLTPQNPGQLEAFPSKEQHISAAVDKAIADVEAELAETPAEVETTPETEPTEAPVAPKKAKKVVEAAPEPVDPPAEPEAPKLSKREQFAADAAKEAEGRAERQEVKELQRKYEETQAQLAESLAFQDKLKTDPLSFFEENFEPDTYEKLTHLYAKGEKPSPERAEMLSLRKELKEIKEAIKSTQELTQQSQQAGWIKDFMRDVDRQVVAEDYKAIREYSEQYERLTGNPVNIHQAAAKEYDDFRSMYKKELTPTEVLDILNEKAEERLERSRPETPAVVAATKEPKSARKPAKTLTNSDETESAPAGEVEDWAGSRDAHLERVARNVGTSLWTGNEVKN